MRIALGAANLGPDHPVRGVPVLGHAALPGWFVEAGPPRTRIELRLRIEQGSAATDAVVNARLLVIPVRSHEGTFRASFAGYVILLVGELLAPLGIGLNYLLFSLFHG